VTTVLDQRDTVPRESPVSLSISRYEAHRLIGGQARRPSRNVGEPTELADMIEADFGGVTVEFKSYGEVGK